MKQWYVVQVYAGYEELVKADLLKRAQEKNLTDFFGGVLVPSARVKHLFGAEREFQDHQLFPGYILVEMELDRQAMRLVETTPRVVRFLGGTTPMPLPQHEVDRVMAQVSGDVEVALTAHDFEVGKHVEIMQGAFKGFSGVIDSVDEEAQRITVMVSIFGRMTPVDLNFDEVKQ